MTTESMYRERLGTILEAAGLVTEEDLDEALETCKATSRRIGDVLVSSGRILEEDILEAHALQLDIPHIHLSNHDIAANVARMVPEDVARKYQLIPVSSSEGRVALAMANPLDFDAIEHVQRLLKCKVDVLLASEGGISALINTTHGEPDAAEFSATLEQAVDAVGEVEVSESVPLEETDVQGALQASEQAPIVRTVNHILKEAVISKASDIHIEPRYNGCEVRYRVDGALRHIRLLPRSIQPAVISRIKIMGDLDIAEHRKPQDGRIAIKVVRRNIDIRLSTLPTQFGERVVLRLFDRGVNKLSMDDLGFEQGPRDTLEELISTPYGILLVTGPTGSGKTTTLYSFLNAVKSPEVNIITVEDPVEYFLDGISQSNVNVRAGLTFATQLRSILRQDPDIILVGEIRDRETAEIAFRASMTGHLVFSTLHCNDAAGAFARLTDMGVEPFLISSSLSGILAQRLVRTICPNCRVEYAPSEDEVALFEQEGVDLAGRPLSRGGGCKACAQTGYRGRALVCEVLPVTQAIRALAVKDATSQDIRTAAAQAGMVTMRADGLRRVLSGQTTLDEVRRKVFVSEE